MSEESNFENSPAGPSSTPGVASTTIEPRAGISSYMKQLLAEKQKLEEKAGPELQLTHKLLANGKFRPCITWRGNVQVNCGGKRRDLSDKLKGEETIVN